jgi:hypothetical protein
MESKSKTYSPSLWDDVIALISTQLSKTKLGKGIEIDHVKQRTSDLYKSVQQKLGVKNLNNIETYLKNTSVVSNIVSICADDVSLIMRDGKIDTNDAPSFLNIIKNIYIKVNTINQQHVTVSISPSELIEICGLLLNTVLSCVLKNDEDLILAMRLTSTAMELLQFSMAGTKNIKCRCC